MLANSSRPKRSIICHDVGVSYLYSKEHRVSNYPDVLHMQRRLLMFINVLYII